MGLLNVIKSCTILYDINYLLANSLIAYISVSQNEKCRITAVIRHKFITDITKVLFARSPIFCTVRYMRKATLISSLLLKT